MLIFLACLHSHNIAFMDLKNVYGSWEARASWHMHIMCMWLSENLVLKGMRWGLLGCWISQSSRLPEQTEALKENVAFSRPRVRTLVLDLQLKTRCVRVQHSAYAHTTTEIANKDSWHREYLTNTLLSMCPWYLVFFWILIVYENYTPKPGVLYTSASKNGRDSVRAHRIQSASPDHLVFPHVHIHIAPYINNYTVKRTCYLQVYCPLYNMYI